MFDKYGKTIFDLSQDGRRATMLPPLDVEELSLDDILPAELRRESELDLPQVTQLDVIRHYTLLSKLNYSVDAGFYPLGSCTMKYNPKINEDMANLPGFSRIHPYQDPMTVQGAMEVDYKLSRALCEISGMDEITLQPAAGAHGEMTGLMLIKQYHKMRKDDKRTKIIVPDAAHGTNPASVAVAGYEVVEVPSTKAGDVDLDALRAVANDEIAGLMLTNPSTLGIFEKNIEEIAEIIHGCGGLLYYDGANLNAIMGKVRPGDMGFDVMHMNIHKTFSTPHGGGGPGSGPVACKKILAPYLPVPVIDYDAAKDEYFWDYDRPESIGKIKGFFGNFGVILRGYSYILSMGHEGLKKASEDAVLNANYIKFSLKDDFKTINDNPTMHEVVFAGLKDKTNGISTLEVAKRLIDYGFHPPTIYFPLIVDQALMVEPTETESRETMDHFIGAMKMIAEEARTNPEVFKTAPHNTPVRRIDEVAAVKNPILRWTPELKKTLDENYATKPMVCQVPDEGKNE
ncbi:Glycine dehydrogenase [decarboxylating] (glycine cleavage system P2 protein) [Clostridiaceae bacterium JG1575]|nr:Glycine dehydrogenase [decarboxylating] (glycine cleavage system P2 protein) [Clostridiaceae bacterium JG1575]